MIDSCAIPLRGRCPNCGCDNRLWRDFDDTYFCQHCNWEYDPKKEGVRKAEYLQSFPGTRIYLANPLGAPTAEEVVANMQRAERYLEYYSKLHPSKKFVATHAWLPKFLDDNNPAERQFALECGQKILSFCDAILLCGSRISAGMEAELRQAVREEKPIFADFVYPDWDWILKAEEIILKEEKNCQGAG